MGPVGVAPECSDGTAGSDSIPDCSSGDDLMLWVSKVNV